MGCYQCQGDNTSLEIDLEDLRREPQKKRTKGKGEGQREAKYMEKKAAKEGGRPQPAKPAAGKLIHYR